MPKTPERTINMSPPPLRDLTFTDVNVSSSDMTTTSARAFDSVAATICKRALCRWRCARAAPFGRLRTQAGRASRSKCLTRALQRMRAHRLPVM